MAFTAQENEVYSTMSDLDVTTLFSVRDKSVLITGACRGIGFMLAKAFAINGARVYITGREPDRCREAEQALRAFGHCVAFALDVGRQEQQRQLVSALSEHEKGLDILINNAATVAIAPFENFPAEGWDEVLEVNLKAPFVLTQLLLPLLRAVASDRSPARVINISSVSGIKPWAQDGFSYAASKAGLIQVSRNLANELAAHRITVNAILPGSILTENLQEHLDVEVVAKTIALGRLGGEQDMAGAVFYLCSAAGAWITGTTLLVDGGQLLQSN